MEIRCQRTDVDREASEALVVGGFENASKVALEQAEGLSQLYDCLLYTSDAADEN